MNNERTWDREHAEAIAAAMEQIDRLRALNADLLAALEAMEHTLSALIEDGRIDWSVDDAPAYHGLIEESRAAIEKART
jgi:hypothetical protein